MRKSKQIKRIYKEIAKAHDVTYKEAERVMAEMIKAAWQNAPPWSEEKEFQLELFPNGQIPSNEEFINKIFL